ncbi:MAG: DUF362 domain-containing protein [Desulfobacula sp.]|nr:DUF362 domain-containing protein [Desulfobacula sp.]
MLIDPNIKYPIDYNPHEAYPEYAFDELSKKNDVYESIRKLLYDSGYDNENFGTPDWNPLGEFIKPGDTVVFKPNFVNDINPVEKDITAVVSNASIIRVMVDYCFIALNGAGKIVIGDAPLQNANFNNIVKQIGLKEIVSFYEKEKKFPINIIDFRKEICDRNNPIDKTFQEGDPLGYSIIDLKEDSCHAKRDVNFNNYRVTDYDPKLMKECHNQNNHKYLISNTILSADIIINIPKLKTHRKAGITCALKNLIGINCLKDYLPHHVKGSVEENGDEYLSKSKTKMCLSSLLDYRNKTTIAKTKKLRAINGTIKVFRKLKKIFQKDSFFEGSWYGNDTIWRTILDLNRILIYADKEGVMHNKDQRKIIVLVDGIVAGEKEGPLEPTSKKCGLFILSTNSVACDYTSCYIMGFDSMKIPQINRAFEVKKYPLVKFKKEDIKIILNNNESDLDFIIKSNLKFVPSNGWKDILF